MKTVAAVIILHYFAIHHHAMGVDNFSMDRSFTTRDTGTIDLSSKRFKNATLIQNDSLTVVRNKEGGELRYYFINVEQPANNQLAANKE